MCVMVFYVLKSLNYYAFITIVSTISYSIFYSLISIKIRLRVVFVCLRMIVDMFLTDKCQISSINVLLPPINAL